MNINCTNILRVPELSITSITAGCADIPSMKVLKQYKWKRIDLNTWKQWSLRQSLLNEKLMPARISWSTYYDIGKAATENVLKEVCISFKL